MRSIPGAIPPCGGAPYSKASSIWPNRDLNCFGIEPQKFKHAVLKFARVNSDGSAADLISVQNEIVRIRTNGKRLAFEKMCVL
jgi:hypothetical protein